MVSLRYFLLISISFAIFFLAVMFFVPAMASPPDAIRILRKTEDVTSLEEIRIAMGDLAAINSEKSAEVFATIRYARSADSLDANQAHDQWLSKLPGGQAGPHQGHGKARRLPA